MRKLNLFLLLFFLAIGLWFREGILLWMLKESTDLNRVYSAVFGWSSIQTAFMFSVYGFMTGSSSKFMIALRGTKALGKFYRDVWSALIAGFILTFTSMGLIIAGLEPKSLGIFFYFVLIWLLLFFGALLLFLRVAYDFGVVIRTKDNRDIPA